MIATQNTYSTVLLSAIAARAENGAIGRHNQIPWRLPADLRWFREQTARHPLLMGRKTYESIGKPLPNRLNLVLSRQALELPAGALGFSDVDAALDFATQTQDNELFVIGGEEIYRLLWPRIERLYLTEVATSVPDADAFLPELIESEWEETARHIRPADAQNPFALTFRVLGRKPAL